MRVAVRVLGSGILMALTITTLLSVAAVADVGAVFKEYAWTATGHVTDVTGAPEGVYVGEPYNFLMVFIPPEGIDPFTDSFSMGGISPFGDECFSEFYHDYVLQNGCGVFAGGNVGGGGGGDSYFFGCDSGTCGYSVATGGGCCYGYVGLSGLPYVTSGGHATSTVFVPAPSQEPSLLPSCKRFQNPARF